MNDAEVSSEPPVEEMNLEERETVVETNPDGVMHGTKPVLIHLRESDGCIISLGSIYGLVGGRGAASYSAAKRGVVDVTQQVAIDNADQGVRVNSFRPSFVETSTTEDLLESERFYNFVEQKTRWTATARSRKSYRCRVPGVRGGVVLDLLLLRVNAEESHHRISDRG